MEIELNTPAPKPKSKRAKASTKPATKAKASTKAVKKPILKKPKEPMRMLALFMVANRNKNNEPVKGTFTNKGLAKSYRNKLNKAYCEDKKIPFGPENGPYYVTFGPDHRKYAGRKA